MTTITASFLLETFSEWFDPAEQKPWEPGVYERKGEKWDCANSVTYCYWDGKHFGYLGGTPEEAKQSYKTSNGRKSCHQGYLWRGLAYAPQEGGA